ncbi:hypothetical protein VTN77DRAFT_3469 [Rasamsonia byssochlamydoides]|uniref:uncharacterized protein n=1 Tax=Rasamsonia byssochlamydoides TaxID=89139 RepID=UPI003743CA46
MGLNELAMPQQDQNNMAKDVGNEDEIETKDQHSNGPISEHTFNNTASEESPAGSSAAPFSVLTRAQRGWITFLVAFAGMFSPMSSFIYHPVINSIAENLGVSVESVNLTVTSYMIVSGIIPAIMGNLADTLGRRPAYMVTFSIYILANVGLAMQRSFPALLTLRMLQSVGSSGTISLSYGVIADIESPPERGFYVGIILLGPNVAPPIGPLLGGAIAARLGWTYIFWFLCCLSGLCLLTIVLSLPETARSIVGNGAVSPTAIYKPWLPVLRHLQVDGNATEAHREGRWSLGRLPNPIQ